MLETSAGVIKKHSITSIQPPVVVVVNGTESIDNVTSSVPSTSIDQISCQNAEKSMTRSNDFCGVKVLVESQVGSMEALVGYRSLVDLQTAFEAAMMGESQNCFKNEEQKQGLFFFFVPFGSSVNQESQLGNMIYSKTVNQVPEDRVPGCQIGYQFSRDLHFG